MDVEVLTFEADPDRGGFGARVHSLIRMLAAFARVRVTLTDWFGGVRVPGVEYTEFPIRDTALTRVRRLRTYYKTDFTRRVVTDSPDLIVTETLDLWALAGALPHVPRILDEHNVYWELLKYDLATTPFFSSRLGRSTLVRRSLFPRVLRRAREYEKRAIRQAEGTFVTSSVDRALVLQELPAVADRVHVLPNTVDVDRFPDLSDAETGNDAIFIGNYAYGPNQEAARFIIDRLAPSLPQMRFLLVGGHPASLPPAKGNVVATGHVSDLNAVLTGAAVCLAPLAQGSGTRLKVLTYLASGKAVVATSKAVEGLEVQDGVHLLIRDDVDAFRKALERLLREPDLRRDLGRNGRRLVQERYDWRIHVDWLKEFTTRLCSEKRG
jgi:glycosyltransferase involved in cell wall biosynthesis